MKAVLMSIRPQWCELIASGQKTVEVRKTRPRLEPPFKCYIYCTKTGFISGEKYGFKVWASMGKVMGEFICDGIADCRDLTFTPSCLTLEQWCKYTDNHKGPVWGWHISELKIYDKPKPLSMFYKECAGLDNTGMCYECENAVGEECDCAVNGRLHFNRPPQSWCYVEELEDGK